MRGSVVIFERLAYIKLLLLLNISFLQNEDIIMHGKKGI